jgi:hypothetical protein
MKAFMYSVHYSYAVVIKIDIFILGTNITFWTSFIVLSFLKLRPVYFSKHSVSDTESNLQNVMF